MKAGITLAVIPARGGSKRLRNKNVLPLLRLPLLGHTLRAAHSSTGVDECLVSTDRSSIAAVARRLRGLVLFHRPARIATDTASNYDVLRHAVEWWERYRGPVEIAVLLQPTSPLRSAADIDKAIRLLVKTGADAVATVTLASPPPEWMVRLSAEGRPTPILRSVNGFRKRKQDLAPAYVPNGAVYVLRRKHLKKGHTAFQGNCRCLVMPRERSIDIDYKEDFLVAEAILRSRRLRKSAKR